MDKRDIPFETLEFENGMELLIEYLDENKEKNNTVGRYTALYRKGTFRDKNDNVIVEKLEENPFYEPQAIRREEGELEELQAQHETHGHSHSHEGHIHNDVQLQVIHQGLDLRSIKEIIENGGEYPIVLWTEGQRPIMIELSDDKEYVLKAIDNMNNLGQLALNVLNRSL